MKTGQWLVGPEGTRWFFDSGSLALDFGYTGDYGYGVAHWEQLRSASDLGSWLVDRFGPLAAQPATADLAVAIRLRAAICRIARCLADGRSPTGDDIDVINAAARVPPLVPCMDGGTTRPPRPTVTAALSTIARDAIATFDSGAERIRHCGADDCALVFHDASRPNSRRWCSMRRCGNRAKVRAYRTHRRGEHG